MNTVNFQQIGGFPLETNTLTEVQKAYSIFNAFGALAGDKTIISGCETQGNEVTNGFIYLDGELLEFRGGIKQTTVVIIQEEVAVEFEDNTVKPVYYTRYATFGVSGNSIPWEEFKRYYINQPIYREVKWVDRDVTNADLPRGWFIANGQNGTRNLLGRMFVGKDSSSEFNTVGKSGGAKEHQLTIGEMPRHRFGFPPGAGGDDGAGRIVAGDSYGTQSLGSAYTNYLGSNQPHNNLPPYIVQIPIQFIG